MHEKNSARPFVETTVARMMRGRMQLTHDECGITVISGPWGIGKTTAIDAFARDNECTVIVVKVEPGATKRGATQGDVLKRVNEALRKRLDYTCGTQISNSTWTLRQNIYTLLSQCFDADDPFARFTFVFDEAQHLSREAIEMLRFWNDHDRTTTPFPVGLIFVGNNEFAMAETIGGDSVLSGAVRSRLLFEVPLEYTHLTDTDLTLFTQSRGVTDMPAIREFVEFFSHPRVKRDLRRADRLLASCALKAGDAPITYPVVREVLSRHVGKH